MASLVPAHNHGNGFQHPEYRWGDTKQGSTFVLSLSRLKAGSVNLKGQLPGEGRGELAPQTGTDAFQYSVG